MFTLSNIYVSSKESVGINYAHGHTLALSLTRQCLFSTQHAKETKITADQDRRKRTGYEWKNREQRGYMSMTIYIMYISLWRSGVTKRVKDGVIKTFTQCVCVAYNVMTVLRGAVYASTTWSTVKFNPTQVHTGNLQKKPSMCSMGRETPNTNRAYPWSFVPYF